MRDYLQPPAGNLTRLIAFFSKLFVTNVWITKMIHRQKKGFCMTSHKNTQKRSGPHRHPQTDRCTPVGPLSDREISCHPDYSDESIVDPPKSEQEISRLAVIRISTIGATIERRKPVMKRADFIPGKKHRLLTTSRTLPSEGSIDINHCLLNRAWGFSHVHARWYGCPALQLSTR